MRVLVGWYSAHIQNGFCCKTTTDDDENESGAEPEFLALKQESRILGQTSNPVCGFSMMEQVRLCSVWPMENWLGSPLNQIQDWTTVRESYFRAIRARTSERSGDGGEKKQNSSFLR